MLQRIVRFMTSQSRPEPFLTTAEIVSKRPLNYDCYLYQLKFQDKPFELRIGEHFRFVETIKTYDAPEGEQIIRKYTPISPLSQKNVLDVLIKIYRPNVDIKFPNGGKFTPYFETLNVGDRIHLQGPFGNFDYLPGGQAVIRGLPKKIKRIVGIAAGSGITPLYQVFNEIANMPGEEAIDLRLLFANKTEKDIIMRKELESLQPRVKLHYILDSPPEQWNGFQGHVTQKVLSEICPLGDPDTLYTFCGPMGMTGFLRDLFSKKYKGSIFYKF